MAEEAEKKPEFVLRKKEKKPEAAQESNKAESSQPTTKKKIVIKKKTPAAPAGTEVKSDSNQEERAKNGVHVVVKKTAPPLRTFVWN